MKKFGVFFISLLLILLTSSHTSAQSPSPLNQKQVRTEEKSQVRAEKMETARNRFDALKRERISNFSNKMLVRIEATIHRLENLVVRVEKRIETIDTETKQLDEVSGKVDNTKKLLIGTKLEYSKLEENVKILTESDNPMMVLEDIKSSLEVIKRHLKEIHSQLIVIVGDLKGLGSKTTN